ncbi:50S ribosomal protein L3 N(5)-glutamine methyltransferase [Marinobacterium sp. D7]|uniref:50S ribosomal protein L3 N(5)-glutamine methyltransferase n=1 Tax=Marinobacterium ramblicola TaxID=2849041 RepID=UPI001C2D8B35|nr:50S ribosomal protein L3 N(5)-glutamine methyltransferase [Marinobacterium ramblicola]MBV1786533.1 50S ribosomal protein L3 N(5)-glutamine methyltransferase [Marinobacterium ramblicola]
MNLDQASLLDELETLRDFVRFSLSAFHERGLYFGHGTDNAWDEAVQLVLNAVHLPWDTRPEVLDARLTRSEKRRVLEYLRQRVEERKPLPYITGEAWFMGLAFNVDERVLIPRSPIAELIEDGYEPWLREGAVERVLDLCTGSGCIGIATALVFPEATVDLVDISEDALAVAASNIKRHQLAERVQVVHSDLFDALDPAQPYDLIVSNPPYVDADDLASMPDEYQHEPDLALGSGDDGLDITRCILREAGRYLSDDGLLVVEVGNSEVHLMEQYPDLPLIWIELERGGNGVFCITAQELRQYSDRI